MRRMFLKCCVAAVVSALTLVPARADRIFDLQTEAVRQGRSPAAHWGPESGNYAAWSSHSNRLIPIYTFGTRGAGPGVDLSSYTGAQSPYRNADAIRDIFGQVPSHTVNPEADYADQTNVADIQQAALEAGRKYVFLVVFDGMDWQTTRAAAIHHMGKVAYDSGRGTGLHFLDYTAAGTSQFGYMVAAPTDNGTKGDVDTQRVRKSDGLPGGYNVRKAGPNPWTPGDDPLYLIGKAETGPAEHAYPDSAGTATAMTTGVKTYNGSINVDPSGNPLRTVAHVAQERGYAVGAVSSVPVSHATPAAAYAHNVSRNDYQDLTRDMLGLPSISHPASPLPGLDVVIGGGFGVKDDRGKGQGANFVPGNAVLADADLKAIQAENGGPYVVAQRQEGVRGNERLQAAAREAARSGKRLFGFYGVAKYNGHFPFRTADGDYRPAPGRKNVAESYSEADVHENVTLAEATTAALEVLKTDPQGFWLMVEAGDVDWANHDNNLDTSIGAVKSGDDAIRVITDWVEKNSNWQESLMIVTADHGHYLVLDRPELLLPAVSEKSTQSDAVSQP